MFRYTCCPPIRRRQGKEHSATQHHGATQGKEKLFEPLSRAQGSVESSAIVMAWLGLFAPILSAWLSGPVEMYWHLTRLTVMWIEIVSGRAWEADAAEPWLGEVSLRNHECLMQASRWYGRQTVSMGLPLTMAFGWT